MQDAAYDTLLKGRRQELHARIGQVLEASFPDTVQAQPELLAHHFTRAGLVDQAIEYCLRAGRVALSRSANVEATAQLQKGLQLLDGLTDPSRRDREEIDLQIGLGSAFMAARGLASPEMGEPTLGLTSYAAEPATPQDWCRPFGASGRSISTPPN